MPLIQQVVQTLMFFLGSAFYIRSSQLFPRKLTAADLHVFVPMSMAITATGIVYFYITLRGPDVEARHKVLWFFEAALAAAITTMFAGAASVPVTLQ
ncbi:MAG: hypothetical protein ABI821_15065 [Pseudomonadota bacterium]